MSDIQLYQAVTWARSLRQHGIGLLDAASEAAVRYDVPRHEVLKAAMRAEEACADARRARAAAGPSE